MSRSSARIPRAVRLTVMVRLRRTLRTRRRSRQLAWDEGRTEAQRLEAGIHTAVGVMRRPAGHILEEANGSNPAIGAEIEPVARAARHANQITGLHLDREDRTGGRADVK